MKIPKINRKNRNGQESIDFYSPVLLQSSRNANKTYLDKQFEKHLFELLQSICVMIGMNQSADHASPVETSKKMFAIQFSTPVNYGQVMSKLVDITHDPETKRFIVFWLAPRGGAVSQKFSLEGEGYVQTRDAFDRYYDLVNSFQDDAPVMITNNSSLLF